MDTIVRDSVIHLILPIYLNENSDYNYYFILCSCIYLESLQSTLH